MRKAPPLPPRRRGGRRKSSFFQHPRGVLMRKVMSLCGAAVVAAAVCAAGAARAQDAPAGDAAAGKRLYLVVGCFTCHGRSGQGGAMNGPAPIIAKTEMPFDSFTGPLRQPINDMPAYS